MIGPKGLLPRLEERRDRPGTWLITPPTEGECFTILDAAIQDTTLRQVQADLDAERVSSAWFLNKNVSHFYRNLLRGLDYLLRTARKPHAVNISVGPSMKYAPLDSQDPIHTIFHNATVKGMFIVVPHGNEGCADGSRDGIINPWAAPEWAISVGACNQSGSEVMSYSSRGVADQPETWPDLVAPGTSALDASQEGTSFAAPRVTGAVDHIIHFLMAFAKEAGPTNALRLRIPEDTLTAGLALGPRLAGTRLPWDEDGQPTFEFDPSPSPKLVKQLLRDFTRPMPGVPPHIVGAGVLDDSRLYGELSAFGKSEAKLLAVRIV